MKRGSTQQGAGVYAVGLPKALGLASPVTLTWEYAKWEYTGPPPAGAAAAWRAAGAAPRARAGVPWLSAASAATAASSAMLVRRRVLIGTLLPVCWLPGRWPAG